MQLPGTEGPLLWQVRGRSDAAALDLASRHYSRQSPGAKWLGPPGRVLTLVTPCERAVWQTHYPRPELALDGLDVYRCTIFRNEGAGLSSTLVEAAVQLTHELWGEHAGGWATWVDVRKVESRHPGYCFKRAGWWLDREYRPWRPGLVRLRYP